jgi:hypothetical protein
VVPVTMPKAKRICLLNNLDDLAQQILLDLSSDFVGRGLTSRDLQDGYVGMRLATLVERHCGSSLVSQVDFDLAIKQLEQGKLVDTGPKAPYENRPGSQIFIMAIISKREHVYLTEAGYRVAQRAKSVSNKPPRPLVHISGGTFHQSPIGIGGRVTQSVTVNDNELADGVRKLVDPLERTLPVSDLPERVLTDSQIAIAELREAASASAPDVGRLRRGLEALKHVMEHATGHLVAAGVLAAIASLLGHAAH